jgi:hypothetical protein
VFVIQNRLPDWTGKRVNGHSKLKWLDIGWIGLSGLDSGKSLDIFPDRQCKERNICLGEK